MQPRYGGRFSLRLESSDAPVRYAVDLETAAGRWSGVAQLDERGEVRIDGLPTDAPAWLLEAARTGLRTLWRNHPNAGWPRRITRWRPEPGE